MNAPRLQFDSNDYITVLVDSNANEDLTDLMEDGIVTRIIKFTSDNETWVTYRLVPEYRNR